MKKLITLLTVLSFIFIGQAFAIECGTGGGSCGTPMQTGGGEPSGGYGSLLINVDGVTDVYTPETVVGITYIDQGTLVFPAIFGTVFDLLGEEVGYVNVSIHSDFSGITSNVVTGSTGFYGPVPVAQGNIDVSFSKTGCDTVSDLQNYPVSGSNSVYVNGKLDCRPTSYNHDTFPVLSSDSPWSIDSNGDTFVDADTGDTLITNDICVDALPSDSWRVTTLLKVKKAIYMSAWLQYVDSSGATLQETKVIDNVYMTTSFLPYISSYLSAPANTTAIRMKYTVGSGSSKGYIIGYINFNRL